MTSRFEHASSEQREAFLSIISEGQQQLIDAGIRKAAVLPYLRSRYPRFSTRWDDQANVDNVKLGAGLRYLSDSYGLPLYGRQEVSTKLVVVHPNLKVGKSGRPWHTDHLTYDWRRVYSKFHGYEIPVTHDQARLIVDLARRSDQLGFDVENVETALQQLGR